MAKLRKRTGKSAPPAVLTPAVASAVIDVPVSVPSVASSAPSSSNNLTASTPLPPASSLLTVPGQCTPPSSTDHLPTNLRTQADLDEYRHSVYEALKHHVKGMNLSHLQRRTQAWRRRPIGLVSSVLRRTKLVAPMLAQPTAKTVAQFRSGEAKYCPQDTMGWYLIVFDGVWAKPDTMLAYELRILQFQIAKVIVALHAAGDAPVTVLALFNVARAMDKFVFGNQTPVELDELTSFVLPWMLRVALAVQEKKETEGKMAPILRVVRAAYDYDAQHDDELAVHEGQLLYVIGEPEPDWLLCSVKGPDGQADLTGNVPENYVEPAPVLYHAVALYDYDATNDDELTVRENDALDVIEALPDDWVVAQCGSAFGLVPANYVEERGDAALASAGPEPVAAAPALPAPLAAAKPAGPPKIATALYDYNPVEQDDLNIHEGENCLVIDDADPDWCKVRIISSKKDRSNKEGFVPRGYLQFKEVGKSPAAAATATPAAPAAAAAPALPVKPVMPAAAPVPPPLAAKPVVAAADPAVLGLDALANALAAQAHEKENADRIRREREAEEERVRRAQEEAASRRASEEAEQKARAELERRERLERDRQERERQQYEEDERRAAAAASAATPPALPARPPLPRHPSSPARPTATPAAANSTGSDSMSSASKDMPDPTKVRIWLDTSGQHRTEAAFVDFVDGKVKLHKTNGARIDVPIAALCTDDQVLAYKLKGIPQPAALAPPVAAPAPKPSSVGAPLATGGGSTKYNGFDWLPFLTSCSVDPQDAHTYAVHFAAEKLDESFLPELTRDILKGLGVKEGDILRIQKRLTTNKTQVQQREADLTTQNLARIEQYFQERVKLSDQSASQLKSDEDLARRLQQEELARANAARGKGMPAGNASSVSSTARPAKAPRRASVSTSSPAPPAARMPRSTSGLPVQSTGIRPPVQDRTNPAIIPGAVPVVPSTVRPMATPVAAPLAGPMPVMQPNRSLPAPLIPTQGTRPGFIPTKTTTPTPAAGTAGMGPAAAANGVANPILGPASLGAMNMGMSQIPAGLTQEQVVTLQRQQQQMMAMAAAGGAMVGVGAMPGVGMGPMPGMMASASGGMQSQGLAGAVPVNQTGRAANWQHATPHNPFGTPLAATAGTQPRPGAMPMAHSVSQGANLAGMGAGGVPNAGLGYAYTGQPGASYMGMQLTQAQMLAMQQQQQYQQQQAAGDRYAAFRNMNGMG
ncbi:cytoskeletal protein binding protein [Allomyces arbusculus]|nr:cytoskeletal protein binding protein [Allomyces arbusculus]